MASPVGPAPLLSCGSETSTIGCEHSENINSNEHEEGTIDTFLRRFSSRRGSPIMPSPQSAANVQASEETPEDPFLRDIGAGSRRGSNNSVSSVGDTVRRLSNGLPAGFITKRKSSRTKYSDLEKTRRKSSLVDATLLEGIAMDSGQVAGAGESPTNTKKLSLSLKYVGTNYAKYVQSKLLIQTQLVPKHKVFEVLETLGNVVIFKCATPEERVLLAQRLRFMNVEDDVYLIREGEDSEPAVFMIASGKATVSVTRRFPDGSLQEVDVKDIKYPDYFGEGRCLTGDKAYASIRAKEGLVVYLLLKKDVDELIGKRTRAIMVRDTMIRKFQKDHLNDLFDVIRGDMTGMLYLCKFAKEQRMDGDLLFFNDIMAYKKLPTDKDRCKHMRRIFDTYLIEEKEGQMSLVYSTTVQRQRLLQMLDRAEMSMARADGLSTPERRGSHSPQRRLSPLLHLPPLGSIGKALVDNASERVADSLRRIDPDRREELNEHRSSLKRGDDQSERRRDEYSERKREGSGSNEAPPTHSIRFSIGGSVIPEDVSKLGVNGMKGGAGETEVPLSQLFDEILEQSAIPTICQGIIPRFIQSKYFDRYLASRFPNIEASRSHPDVLRRNSTTDKGGEKDEDFEFGWEKHPYSPAYSPAGGRSPKSPKSPNTMSPAGGVSACGSPHKGSETSMSPTAVSPSVSPRPKTAVRRSFSNTPEPTPASHLMAATTDGVPASASVVFPPVNVPKGRTEGMGEFSGAVNLQSRRLSIGRIDDTTFGEERSLWIAKRYRRTSLIMRVLGHLSGLPPTLIQLDTEEEDALQSQTKGSDDADVSKTFEQHPRHRRRGTTTGRIEGSSSCAIS